MFVDSVMATAPYQKCACTLTCSAWHKAATGKSTRHRVQNQLSSNWDFSQFVSLSPSHLFVFFSCSPSPSLCLQSPAALDYLSALKSSLALLACQAADGTNGYLRSCPPLPPPPKLFLLLLSALCSLLFLFILPPVLHLFLHVAPDHPACFHLRCYLAGDWGGLCSADHRAVQVWSGTNQACRFVCAIWSPQRPAAGAPRQTHT